MSWFTGSVTYFLLWWLVFFICLPFGAAPAKNVPPGFDTSAPENPRLWPKIILSSIVATLMWGAIYWLVKYSSVTLEDLPFYGII